MNPLLLFADVVAVGAGLLTVAAFGGIIVYAAFALMGAAKEQVAKLTRGR